MKEKYVVSLLGLPKLKHATLSSVKFSTNTYFKNIKSGSTHSSLAVFDIKRSRL